MDYLTCFIYVINGLSVNNAALNILVSYASLMQNPLFTK